MHSCLSALLLMLLAGPLGCARPAPVTRMERFAADSGTPTPGDEFPAEEVTQAEKLSVTKCARCHKLYTPLAYSNGEWQRWVIKMRRKARLNPDQEALLIRYGQSLKH